jgi:hypothetical protein
MTENAGRRTSDRPDRRPPGQRHHRGTAADCRSGPRRHHTPGQSGHDAEAPRRRLPVRRRATDPDGPRPGGRPGLRSERHRQPRLSRLSLRSSPRPRWRCQRNGGGAESGPSSRHQAPPSPPATPSRRSRRPCTATSSPPAQSKQCSPESHAGGRTHHPIADPRSPPHSLRTRATSSQADRRRATPQTALERPVARLQGGHLLARAQTHRRIRRLGRSRPPPRLRQQSKARPGPAGGGAPGHARHRSAPRRRADRGHGTDSPSTAVTK